MSCVIRGLDNSCVGGGSGPPGPPGPVNPLLSVSVCEDFSEMTPGNISEEFDFIGFKVRTNDLAHNPIIFNSNVPSAGQFELGSPNVFYGGPGVGAGGGPGPGANPIPLNNILVISDDNNPADPKSSVVGGTLTFYMSTLVNTKNIDLINVATPGWFVKLYDKALALVATIPVPVLGVNSFQSLSIAHDEILQMEVIMTGVGGVSRFCYERGISIGTTYGYLRVIDDGTLNTAIPNTANGVYQILISSVVFYGAKSTFMLAKSFPLIGGSTLRLANSKAFPTGEDLQMVWPAGMNIQVYHDIPTAFPTGAYITYKYALISIL